MSRQNLSRANSKPLEHQDSYEQMPEEELDIMSMLHKTKLKIIENDFSLREKGLKLNEFVTVMLEHLDYERFPLNEKLKSIKYEVTDYDLLSFEEKRKREEERFHREEDLEKSNLMFERIKKRITVSLIDLFKEIDVNGDETMEWEEFSNHIIELGLLRKDRTFRNVIKNYYPSEVISDKEKHETDIERVYYFDSIKNLIVLEKESPKFKVYNSNNSELLCEINAHKGAILSAEILPEQNLIATSSNDLTINFWDTSSFNLKQILSTPEIQLVVRNSIWNSTSNLLYTGGSDAIIHIYDANTLKEKATLSGWNPFFKKDTQQYGHAGPIGDILPIKHQNTLVTAALDGKICLWDVPTHTFKKELQGHEKGVYSLDWADWTKMHQCLISAGLDHEAYVWNTYVKEKIFALRGHNHPLIGVKWLPDSPQVITADISGMVKIWDVRNFENKQSLACTTEELNAFAITYKGTKKRIVVGSRHLTFYEYDEPKDQLLTDEKMCLKVLFNSVMLCFITLHPDSLKVWDAKTGKLISVHRELSRAELTVCILDNRQRKLFVGDSDGRIFTVNIKNGAKMKKFERHHKMITDLAYWTSSSVDNEKDKDIRRIVSISREDNVNIHDEDSPDPHHSVRYNMKQHKKSCNSLSVKKGTDLIASCSDDGIVVITNLTTYRQEVLCRKDNEIKKVLFLDQFDCLCASDSEGNIMFFGVGNSKFKNKQILQIEYKTLSATNHLEKFPLSCMAFCSKLELLLLGDEFGNVAVWNVGPLLQKLHEFRIEKNATKKSRAESLISQDESSSQKKNEGFFATEPEITDSCKKKGEESMIFPIEEDPCRVFSKDLIIFETPIKKEHNDGITWIEIIEEYQCFATSSFDCCCHIWSFEEWEKTGRKEWKKIGSLILGTDLRTQNIILRVDEKRMQEDAEGEADCLLKELDDFSGNCSAYERMFKKIEKEEEETKKKEKNGLATKSQKMMDILQENDLGKSSKFKEKKSIKKDDNNSRDKVFEKARNILERHQELKKKEWKVEENELNLLNIEDEGELFQGEEDQEENDYNILYDLNDFNKSSQAGGGFTSKSAFKTKLFSKGRLKVKLK